MGRRRRLFWEMGRHDAGELEEEAWRECSGGGHVRRRHVGERHAHTPPPHTPPHTHWCGDSVEGEEAMVLMTFSAF